MRSSSADIATAAMGETYDTSDYRASSHAWLVDWHDEVVTRMHRRINAVTGYQTSWLLDGFRRGREYEYEVLQVNLTLLFSPPF